MTQRDATWVVHPFALWESSDDDERVIGWAKAFRDDIARLASGGVYLKRWLALAPLRCVLIYLNFIGDEGADRIRAAFEEEKYRRLPRIKAEYDPDNVFRGNQNIEPALAGARRPTR